MSMLSPCLTAHSGRVTDLKFLPDQEWLISVGRDKSFQFYCTKTGRKLGTYEAQAWCLAVEYPFIVVVVMRWGCV